MPSLLVSNDFPPKVGGIQSYLWELWRRLPPHEVTVLTTAQEGSDRFDAGQRFRVERADAGYLLPTRRLAGRVRALAREVSADLVFLDPALPLGWIGPRLGLPYVLVLHGAEVTVPGRLPGSRRALRRVLRRAEGVLAAGPYPAREALRLAGPALRGLVVPPGVDAERFRPLAPGDRERARRRLGIDPGRPVVLGVSRLVPRKGFDVLIDVMTELESGVQLVIAGDGRDRRRLEERAQRRGLGSRARFVGRVGGDDLPALYGSADVFAMLCRSRWAGLEQEGFGIVFLEAAACGVPAVAGRSGGAADAVVDGETGFVVDPRDRAAAAQAVRGLLSDQALRAHMGDSARARAEGGFSYEGLASRLAPLVGGDRGALAPLAAELERGQG